MWIGRQPVGGRRDAYARQNPDRAVFGGMADSVMRTDCLDHLVRSAEPDSVSSSGPEDHRDPVATRAAHLAFDNVADLTFEVDLAADHLFRSIHKSPMEKPVTDMRKPLSPTRPSTSPTSSEETDAVHRLDDACIGEEMGLQIAHIENTHRVSLGFRVSRSRSPTMLMEATIARECDARIHAHPVLARRQVAMPFAISSPSDGWVMGTPTPRKDNELSSTMVLATCTVEITISGGMQLGNR